MNSFLKEEYKKETDYILDNYLEYIARENEEKTLADNCSRVSSVTFDNEIYDLYTHKTETSTGFHLVPKEENLYHGNFSHMITFDADLDGMNFSHLHKNNICIEFFNYNYILEKESIYSIYEYYVTKYLNDNTSIFHDFTPDILRKYRKQVREEIKHASMIRRSKDNTVGHYINNINKIGKFKYIGQSNEFYNGLKYQNKQPKDEPIIKIHEHNLGCSSKTLVKK